MKCESDSWLWHGHFSRVLSCYKVRYGYVMHCDSEAYSYDQVIFPLVFPWCDFGKETWGFTSTETIKAYYGRGSWGGGGIFISDTYSLHWHHQNDCIKAGSRVSDFNVSLIVWAKSQDGVHKPQFLKRRERTAEADRTKVRLFTSQALYR